MRAARSVTVEDVELVDVPDPVPGPGEVVCRVLACGVCGSDVSPSWVSRKVPAVLGHEVVGEVAAVGAGLPPEFVGRRVIVHHHVECGACEACDAGHTTLCEQFRSTRIDPGGFAEQVLVQRELVDDLLPLGGLALERAVFVEPLACVLRALPDAISTPTDLLVVGAGTGGLLAVAAARATGLYRAIYVREPRAERRALAEALGAQVHRGEPCGEVLLCTPARAALDDAVAGCALGATLTVYATPSGRLELDFASVYAKDVVVRSSYSADRWDMREAYELLDSGAVDPTPLITHRLPLAETAEALRLQRDGTAIKALVLP